MAAKKLQRMAKHAVDFVGATTMLTVLSPLFFLIALCIKLDDGGPVFFRRRVVGQNGEFDAFKFRTMVVNAEAFLESNRILQEEYRRNFKLKNDPRITRFGAWLRKYSLDELPQLLNVSSGEMSLVGPRMSTAKEFERYGSSREVILQMKPGISGYWQVNGRQDVSFEDHVAMDVYYVKNWNLWMDLGILLKTPLKVISGEGAY
jgi:lipopolysaccharide/colanic/teichoic acid biosynthesis glycosyltransferase